MRRCVVRVMLVAGLVLHIWLHFPPLVHALALVSSCLTTPADACSAMLSC
jgi:hypothetical protein